MLLLGPNTENPPPAISTTSQKAAALNHKLRNHGATAVLSAALRDGVAGQLALVSSFGAESVALLHLAAMVDRHVPVIFIDTRFLFAETLTYQMEVAERLGLRNLRIIHARDTGLPAEADPNSPRHDPETCCAVRKSAPLNAALKGYDGWITGRKRYQSGTRAGLEFFEADPLSQKIKLNPLAHWRPGDVETYIAENRLPRHPLVARGYPSIGCAPCTSPARDGEDARAGRWRGREKTECGIHLPAPNSTATGG